MDRRDIILKLAENDGIIHFRSIRDKISDDIIDPKHISDLLRGLWKKGLLERHDTIGGRMKYKYTITDKGRLILNSGGYQKFMLKQRLANAINYGKDEPYITKEDIVQ